MAIIKTYPNSLEGYQAKLKDQISSSSTSTLASLVSRLKYDFALIWQNPNLTPQQSLDAFGTDAATLFAMANATAQMIAVIDPASAASLPTPASIGRSYVENEDGTVTVTS